MERSVSQQFFEYLQKSQHILIALPEAPVFEAVAAAQALLLALEAQGKQVQLASSGTAPGNFGFSQRPPVFSSPEKGSGSLIVVLNTAEKQLDELSYTAENQSVKIFLKAKQGTFAPTDISVTEDQSSAYDLIITMDASSLDDLGELFHQNTELFYGVPKINIDTKAKNEYFGAVNLVDVTASSHGELLADLLLSEAGAEIPEQSATLLLASIISATTSFQDVRTTPKTLAIAARLVELGARQQDVIVSLFKTKDFALLKLWGRVLARIKTDGDSLLYSSLNSADFSKTETGGEHLFPVFRELLDNISGYQTIALLAETVPGKLHALIASLPHVVIDGLLSSLSSEPPKVLPPYGAYRMHELELAGQDLTAIETLLLQQAPKIGNTNT